MPFLCASCRRAEGAVVYTGEWVEEGLSDWLLGQDVPPFGDLARGDEKADMYANKFFSSSLPKFIAFTDGFECDLLRIQVSTVTVDVWCES